MALEARHGKPSTEKPAQKTSLTSEPVFDGQKFSPIRLTPRAEGIVDGLKAAANEKASEPGFLSKFREKIPGTTRKGKIVRRISVATAGLSLGAAAAPHIDIDQAARENFKNRAPLEQVVAEAASAVSIENAEADGGGSFADVPTNHPYYNDINFLVNFVNKYGRTVINGYDDGTFKPQNPVLRAQFAKMMDNAVELDVKESQSVPFSDMGKDDPNSLYPHEYAGKAAEVGITKGYGDGTFKPYKDINRAQTITMAMRYLEGLGVLKTPPAGYESKFGDFDPGHAKYMNLAAYNGVLDRLPTWTGTDPWKVATRGETAAIVHKVIELKEKPIQIPAFLEGSVLQGVTVSEVKGWMNNLPQYRTISEQERNVHIGDPLDTAYKAKVPDGNVIYASPQAKATDGDLRGVIVDTAFNLHGTLQKFNTMGIEYWQDPTFGTLYNHFTFIYEGTIPYGETGIAIFRDGPTGKRVGTYFDITSGDSFVRAINIFEKGEQKPGFNAADFKNLIKNGVKITDILKPGDIVDGIANVKDQNGILELARFDVFRGNSYQSTLDLFKAKGQF